MESLIFPLLIVLLAVPLFMQARRQKRMVQEQQKLLNSLQAGDRVMTTSGLFGTVVGTSEETVDLEIAPGVTTTWVRAAIRERVSDNDQPTESAGADSDESSGAKVAEPIEQQKNN
ncbi:preprotein translocase subunit YajC [Saccharopolyspora rectivirgula]|jgi:preprotein translocase subunit YajC|uniref:Preprotein translocase subunit YajC n=1 Tax=Saccharopolyspora rectivirgula TaxID=28042 RepID=A0A073B0E9_9PSEU|nr:preprotein translocase subunit YajC [Saccharopolyspora rectivirgula]KEI44757.1 preprotein translocase subunit YajC [Saccharopolyspora rectivirgula]